MSNTPNPKEVENESLDQRIHAQLASKGWRLPQSEREVRAAEESVASDPTKLPDRLGALPDGGRPHLPGGLLEHYLRGDGIDRVGNDARPLDGDRPERDLDR